MISIPKFEDDEGMIRARSTMMIHPIGLIILCPFLIDHYSIQSFVNSFPSLSAIAPGKGIPSESKISHATVIHTVNEIYGLANYMWYTTLLFLCRHDGVEVTKNGPWPIEYVVDVFEFFSINVSF